MSEWKGWALGNSALYFNQPRGSSYVGIFLQVEDQSRQVGAFSNVDDALEVQDWLDAAITNVGQANAALVERLQELQDG